MYICKQLYEEIFINVRTDFPEMGGVMGGTEGVIRAIQYDEGILTGKKCSYIPDVEKMNKTIQEVLIGEMRRLQRMNEKLEDRKNEPEHVVQNVLAMCEIAKIIQF